MKPIISVVVPVYNVPKELLINCFDSLLKQKSDKLEFIIIDDGSTNGSEKICDEYKLRDNRFKVFHQKNQGLSETRNVGVRNSHGIWITFLDGDDFFSEKFLDRLINYVDKNGDKFDVLCFGLIRRLPNKSFLFNYNNEFRNGEIYDSKQMLKAVLDFKCQMGDATSKLISASLLKKNKIYHDSEIKQGIEGLLFCINLFYNAKRTIYIDEYCYNYMYNSNSITISDSDKNQIYIFNGFKKIKEFLINNKMSNDLINSYYNRILYIIVGAAISVYFSPNNEEKYTVKKKKFKKYLKNEIISEALKKGDVKKLDFQRKIIITLIKCHIFFLFPLFGIIRKMQKEK